MHDFGGVGILTPGGPMDTQRLDEIVSAAGAHVGRRRSLWVLAGAGLAALGVATSGLEANATTKAKRRRKRQKAYRKRRNARIRAALDERVAACQERVPVDAGPICYAEWVECCNYLNNTNWDQGMANYCSCLSRNTCAHCVK